MKFPINFISLVLHHEKLTKMASFLNKIKENKRRDTKRVKICMPIFSLNIPMFDIY
jgi:hypothetical protein